jgi:hypothetical protein
MGAAKLTLAAVAFELSLIGTVVAAGCEPCTLAMPFGTGPRCVPNGGILVFNSVPPNVPAYWTLFADTHGILSLRRLDGRLEVHADVVDPGVPGFPGELRDGVYFGDSAQLTGTVRRNKVRVLATYPDGSQCNFRLTLAFGLGRARPNAFVCRNAAGEVIADGGVDLQGVRLQGCRRGRRSSRPPYP